MSTYERAGTLRGDTATGRRDLSTSQKLIIFTLSMSLFGLSNIILEPIPDLRLGPLELSVSYFTFIPLVLAALFNPFWVALGAPLGEIIFTDLLLGDFSGLAEVEGFLQMFLAIYIGGSLIRNPLSRAQIITGGLVIVVIDKVLSAVVDLSKVWFGLEDAETDEALLESLIATEVIYFGVDLVLAGVLFGVLPALWLVPKLYRTIEPLLGMAPRVPGEPIAGSTRGIATTVALVLVLGIASAVFAFLESWDASVGTAEWGLLEEYGNVILLVPGAIFVLLIAGVVLLGRRDRSR